MTTEKLTSLRMNSFVKFFMLLAVALLVFNCCMILMTRWLEYQINAFYSQTGNPYSIADNMRGFLDMLNVKANTITTHFTSVTLIVLFLSILLSVIYFFKPSHSKELEKIDFEDKDDSIDLIHHEIPDADSVERPPEKAIEETLAKVENLKLSLFKNRAETEMEKSPNHPEPELADSASETATAEPAEIKESPEETSFPDEMDDEIDTEDSMDSDIDGTTDENGEALTEKDSAVEDEPDTLAHSYSKMVEAMKKVHELERQHSIELATANKKLQKEILERKKAEAEIRHLSNRLISGIEEARKDLAQDLHDEFGQTLAALHLELEGLWNSMPNEMEEQKSRIDGLVILIEQLGDKIRNISSELRPDLLDDLGLVPTLDWYITELSESHPEIHISFQSVGFRKRLPSGIELVLYRVFQESMNNILKHSKAENVDVALTYSHPNIFLTIKDDGVGFDTGKASDGIGLLGMRERVVSVNGIIEIHSGKNKGVTIRVELPVS